MNAETRRRVLCAAGGLGVLLMLVGLAYLRRHGPELDELYSAGNVLNTHETSELSRNGAGVDLAHVEFAVLAGMSIVFAGYASRRRVAAIVAFAVSFVTIYLDSLARNIAVIAGHLYLLISDDALISMRYARNFAEGRGLVYNAGEWVDGFSNPLWTFVMVVPHALHLHEGVTTVPITLLGGALLIGAALLSAAALDRLRVPLAIQLAVMFAIVFDASSFEFALVGLETPLLAMASALLMYGVVSKRRWPVFVGLPLLTLARADGAAIATALLGWLILEEAAATGDRLSKVALRNWKYGLLVVATTLALVAWRYRVYGYPAPNTYYLKVYPIAARLRTGLAEYGVRGVAIYGLAAVVVLWSAAVNEAARPARRLLIPVTAVWIYSIYVGGDAFLFMRFVGPVVPLLWTAVGLALAPRWSERTTLTNALLLGFASLLVPVRVERGVLGTSWDRSGWVEQNLVAMKTIERNVPVDATVATFFAGMPYYAPNHRFVDLLGKTESHIAHQTEIHGALPGHNKFDFAYAYQDRRPDVTFTALSCIDVEHFLAVPPAEHVPPATFESFVYAAPAFQLLDPTFVRLYAPHRVALVEGANNVPVGHPVGCWFVREGSATPIEWHVARE